MSHFDAFIVCGAFGEIEFSSMGFFGLQKTPVVLDGNRAGYIGRPNGWKGQKGWKGAQYLAAGKPP